MSPRLRANSPVGVAVVRAAQPDPINGPVNRFLSDIPPPPNYKPFDEQRAQAPAPETPPSESSSTTPEPLAE